MAEAHPQTAPAFVFLKVARVALENLGLGDVGVKRCVVQGCGDGSIPYRHEGARTPPGFWYAGDTPDLDALYLNNFTFDGSDITNAAGDGGYAFTLRNVRLSWEALAAKHPELGAEPPRLGTSRVEVTAAPSLMRWFEMLVSWLRRKPSPTVRSKEPTGWQAERALRAMRTRLYPTDGRAPRSKELKQLEGEIGAVLALEEQGKSNPKPAPSPEVVSTVVAFLGRSDG